MITVVGVSFRKAGKIYTFATGGARYEKGEHVVVETVRGLEIGIVSSDEREIDVPADDTEIKQIIRKASQEDLVMQYKKRILACRALKICKRKIKEYDLAMKLVDVEYAYDDSKIIFYFSADGRIDFRNLVKELAVIFKKRIELHQIGVRDEAKILGAVGLCGRPVCCSVYMPEFLPVSIKMAKEQNLSLNPERISGVCGRFMCCLRYEHDVYHEGIKKYPSVGALVQTPQGRLKVLEQRIAKGTVVFENLEQERVEFKLSELPEFAEKNTSAQPQQIVQEKTYAHSEEEKKKEIISYGMIAESLLASAEVRNSDSQAQAKERKPAPKNNQNDEQKRKERRQEPKQRTHEQPKTKPSDDIKPDKQPAEPVAKPSGKPKFRILPFELSQQKPVEPLKPVVKPAEPAAPSKKKAKIKFTGAAIAALSGFGMPVKEDDVSKQPGCENNNGGGTEN